MSYSSWCRLTAECWQSLCIHKLDGNYLQTVIAVSSVAVVWELVASHYATRLSRG